MRTETDLNRLDRNACTDFALGIRAAFYVDISTTREWHSGHLL